MNMLGRCPSGTARELDETVFCFRFLESVCKIRNQTDGEAYAELE
jgi:hypothetical protein